MTTITIINYNQNSQPITLETTSTFEQFLTAINPQLVDLIEENQDCLSPYRFAFDIQNNTSYIENAPTEIENDH